MVIKPRIWVITKVTLLVTLLTTTHEPPSRPTNMGKWARDAKAEVVQHVVALSLFLRSHGSPGCE